MRVMGFLLALALAMPGAAFAATFKGTVSIAGAFADPGLVIGVAPATGGFATPDLQVGESHRFDLFRIWTDAGSLKPDDRVAQPITATVRFGEPLGVGAFSGSTVGEPVGRFYQQGRLEWDGPLTLNFGPNGSGQVTLSLSEAIFNKGFRSLAAGAQNGAMVSGTLRYDVAPVPLPAALPLLIGAFGLMGATVARRRRVTV